MAYIMLHNEIEQHRAVYGGAVAGLLAVFVHTRSVSLVFEDGGTSLDRLIKAAAAGRGGGAPNADAASKFGHSLLTGLGPALAHIHKRGRAHGDVHPRHIALSWPLAAAPAPAAAEGPKGAGGHRSKGKKAGGRQAARGPLLRGEGLVAKLLDLSTCLEQQTMLFGHSLPYMPLETALAYLRAASEGMSEDDRAIAIADTHRPAMDCHALAFAAAEACLCTSFYRQHLGDRNRCRVAAAIVADPAPWRRHPGWPGLHPGLRAVIDGLGDPDRSARWTVARALQEPFLASLYGSVQEVQAAPDAQAQQAQRGEAAGGAAASGAGGGGGEGGSGRAPDGAAAVAEALPGAAALQRLAILEPTGGLEPPAPALATAPAALPAAGEGARRRSEASLAPSASSSSPIASSSLSSSSSPPQRVSSGELLASLVRFLGSAQDSAGAGGTPPPRGARPAAHSNDVAAGRADDGGLPWLVIGVGRGGAGGTTPARLVAPPLFPVAALFGGAAPLGPQPPAAAAPPFNTLKGSKARAASGGASGDDARGAFERGAHKIAKRLSSGAVQSQRLAGGLALKVAKWFSAGPLASCVSSPGVR